MIQPGPAHRKSAAGIYSISDLFFGITQLPDHGEMGIKFKARTLEIRAQLPDIIGKPFPALICQGMENQPGSGNGRWCRPPDWIKS